MSLRLPAIAFVMLLIAACGSKGGSQPTEHVSATCPMSFSQGVPGLNPCFDAGPSCEPMAPPFMCQPLPSQCATNPTCDCIACNSECGACSPLGNGQYSDGGGGGATCSYDPASGTFTVECINA